MVVGEDECLGTDRHEAAGQEGPERRCVARRDLGPHERRRVDTSQPGGDQPAAVTSVTSARVEQLDGQLEPTNEARAEGDQPVLVAEDPHISAVPGRPPNTRMIGEVVSFGQRFATARAGRGAACHQHGVVGPDLAGGAGEPAQDIGVGGAAEPIPSTSDHRLARDVGHHDRVARELDHGEVPRPCRRMHLDRTVDGGELPVGGGDEEPVEWMHPSEATAPTSSGSATIYGRRMRVDVMTTPRPLRAMSELAHRSRAAGFDGMLLTEAGRTAFNAATAASLAEPQLELSTGVAVAFPRSPMIAAQNAWELQESTGGHFRLGLGTQVRTHIVRRFGGDFDRPGPRLRDYVLAVKACFAAFRGDTELDHHGEFYELTFLNRQWSPGPIDAPDPKVDVAAVNPWMLEMAGEVADGVHIHPIGEPGYLRRHALPRIAAGASAAGRDVEEVSLIVPVTTIVGDTDAELAAGRDAARLSLSFYGSTPNYAFIWDEAGFEGTTARVREHQKAGDFGAMAGEITDDHLAAFCVESSWDGLADALIDTYGDIVDRLVLYNPAGDTPERFDRYGAVAREVSDRTR